mmetsp:Transcript_2960/g.8949  ORF Transcript_2960/g.8949 Transcript_2960/m.8949 type:complete len:293 (+) Transcript_2960:263-1141(+)
MLRLMTSRTPYYIIRKKKKKETPTRDGTLAGEADGVLDGGHADEGEGGVVAVVVEVDVVGEGGDGGRFGGFGAVAGGGDVGADVLLDGLELVVGGAAEFEEHFLDVLDGVARGAHGGDFVAVAVGRAGVGHGVAVVAVRRELDEERPVAGADVFFRVLHAFSNRKNVHAVDFQARNHVAHGVILSVARGPRIRGAHAVLVIFNHEHHRKFPQHRHVRSLGDLALIRGAVSIARDRDRHFLAGRRLVLVRKRQARADRNLRADDALSSVKILRLVVKVHRPALPSRLTGLVAH